MSKKINHFMNAPTSDIPLSLALECDTIETTVNGRKYQNLVKNGKQFWLFQDKNGVKRWGMKKVEPVETITEQG